MIKGDRIKLVKKMGVFDNIGEICEVTDIQKGGVICFKFGGCHLGCMSFDEYEKYFEKVEEHGANGTQLKLGLETSTVRKKLVFVTIEIMGRKFNLEVVHLK